MILLIDGRSLKMECGTEDVEFATWLLKKYPDYWNEGDSMAGMAKNVIEGLQELINE